MNGSVFPVTIFVSIFPQAILGPQLSVQKRTSDILSSLIFKSILIMSPQGPFIIPLASTFDINPVSVTEIFQKLSQEGYIDYEKYNDAILTKKGENLAIKTLDKHNRLKEFLILLGVDDKTAEIDACEMEHILHKSTMVAIIKFIGDRK